MTAEATEWGDTVLRKKVFFKQKSAYSEEHKVTELRLYSEDKEKIFLEFCPVRVPDDWDIQAKDWDCYDSLRVFRSDYERLLSPLIEKLFPLKDLDPYYGGEQEYFDATGPNWTDIAEWEHLKELLAENSKISTPEEQEFYTEVLRYFEWAESVSGYFCIDGNL